MLNFQVNINEALSKCKVRWPRKVTTNAKVHNTNAKSHNGSERDSNSVNGPGCWGLLLPTDSHKSSVLCCSKCLFFYIYIVCQLMSGLLRS